MAIQILLNQLEFKFKTIFCHNKTDLQSLDSWSNYWGSVHDRLAVFLCRYIIVLMVFNRGHEVQLPLYPFCVIVANIGLY